MTTKRFALALASLLVIASLVLAACGGAPATPQTVEKVVTKEVQVEKVVTKEVEKVVTKEVEKVVEVTPTPAPDRVQIYWYIGLGAGSQPQQIPPEKEFVDKYNKAQSEIQLIPIIVDNNYARDNLIAQIAAGNSPDIVGPVGAKGRGFFPGAFADLAPMMKELNYDMGDVDPKFLDFYKDEGKLVGLPFAIFPSFIYVNKALFKEAGLELPPQKYGDKYKLDGKDVEWNFDTLLEISKRLTVDKNGNDATSAKFDATNVVQYGFDFQFTDARGIATEFGPGIPVDDKGNAVIPDVWKDGWSWYYDAMWKYHVTPNQAALNSDLLRPNAFGSGKTAMVHCHLWFTCCVEPKTVTDWDIAVVPSYKGKTTAKMHGDTFSILTGSKHPKEAFKVISYMLGEGAPDLYTLYGGLPARKSQQAAFFANLDKQFAPVKVNWQVALDGLNYFDVPNHEAGLPNFAKADDAIQKFTSDMRSNDKLDIAKRIDELQTELDGIYKTVKK